MLDASALLWRLLLDGSDTGGRFGPLADAWAPKAAAEPWYAFNDLHATMALIGAGRMAEAHAVANRLDRWLDGGSGTNARMTAEIGLPACRAVIAFAEDRHADVIADLMPIRRSFQHFGGSHAQRDALQRTLLESALRSGRFELARALTAERLGVRETSVYGWTQRARALHGLGDITGSASARRARRRLSHQVQLGQLNTTTTTSQLQEIDHVHDNTHRAPGNRRRTDRSHSRRGDDGRTGRSILGRVRRGRLEHDRSASFAGEHLDRLCANGFLASPIPVALGGAGVDSVHDVLVAMSRLARGDAATSIGVNMHFAVLLNIVRRWQVATARGETEVPSRWPVPCN